MFKKENRLSTTFEFNIARKYGKKLSADLCILYFVKPHNYEGPTKVGIVVSNKLQKVAAKRSRLKRLFREAIKPHFKNLPESLWIAVHPRSKSLEASYEEISSCIDNLISQISVS